MSMGDPGHHPCGLGDKEGWPRTALPRPVSTSLPHQPGTRGHWAPISEHQTRYAWSSGEEAKAPSGSGGRAGSRGWEDWGRSRVHMVPEQDSLPLLPSLLPALLVSEGLPQLLLLPRRAPTARCRPLLGVQQSPVPPIPFVVGLTASPILCGVPSPGAWSPELPWKVPEIRRSSRGTWGQRCHQTPLGARGTCPVVSGVSQLVGGRWHECLGACGATAGAPEPGQEENKA